MIAFVVALAVIVILVVFFVRKYNRGKFSPNSPE